MNLFAYFYDCNDCVGKNHILREDGTAYCRGLFAHLAKTHEPNVHGTHPVMDDSLCEICLANYRRDHGVAA
jgi:hypothetical protein